MQQFTPCFVSQDWLKYPQQWFGQLVLQVVGCVYGNTVVQYIEWILGGREGGGEGGREEGREKKSKNKNREYNSNNCKNMYITSDFMYTGVPVLAAMMT